MYDMYINMRTWLRKFVIYIPESDCKSTRNTILCYSFHIEKEYEHYMI